MILLEKLIVGLKTLILFSALLVCGAFMVIVLWAEVSFRSTHGGKF